MPMGLSTAPLTFQQWMESSLRGFEDFVLIYMDDVLVYSQDEARYEKHLIRLFERFREKRMKLKRKKCSFICSAIPFLGYWILEGWIQVDQDKLGRLREWNTPLARVKEV